MDTNDRNPFIDDDEDQVTVSPTDVFNPFLDNENSQVTAPRADNFNPFIDGKDHVTVAPSRPAETAALPSESLRNASRNNLSRFVKPANSETTERVLGLSTALQGFKDAGIQSEPTESSSVLEQLLEEDDDHVQDEKPSVKDWQRPKTPAERREKRRREREAREQGITLPGHKKRTKNLTYRRNQVTEKDLLVFEFLARVQMASTLQVSQLLGVKDAGGRLRGLREWHMLNASTLYDGRRVWVIGKKGLRTVREQRNLNPLEGLAKKTSEINPTYITHTLSITQAVLNGLKTGLGSAGKIKLHEFMSETAIDRGFFQDVRTRTEEDLFKAYNIRKQAHREAEAGKISWRDVASLYPSLWTPIEMKGEVRRTHQPDGVINREHLRTSTEPVSYAIEVEISGKSNKELRTIMQSYAQDSQYKKVIYLMKSETFARNVHRAAQQAGVASKVEFLQLRDAEGNPFTGRTWKL